MATFRMFGLLFLCVGLASPFILVSTIAYTSQHTKTVRWNSHSNNNVCTRLDEQRSAKQSRHDRKSRRRPCDPCEGSLKEDALLDRREAAFAMIGALWATTTTPYAAHATTGDEANLAFPDVLQGMSNRVSKQCLVESLGNRECLVYQEDADKLLYKGADSRVLLQRMEQASESLQQLPPLIERKKWSQVVGVLTGSMGELIKTMNAIAKLQDDASRVAASEKQVQVVKKDLYAITAAVDKKDTTKALQAYELAANDLAVFIKGLV